jgi:hypothetical protein
MKPQIVCDGREKKIRRPCFVEAAAPEQREGGAHWARKKPGRPWAEMPKSTEDPQAVPELASTM